LNITLNWKISDRSFFTRLVNQLSVKPFLTMEVTTDIEDKDFEKYLENPTLRLPNEIGVMSLYLK
jgi:ATP phosphoribosyltransferase regulatory subunit HisZ